MFLLSTHRFSLQTLTNPTGPKVQDSHILRKAKVMNTVERDPKYTLVMYFVVKNPNTLVEAGAYVEPSGPKRLPCPPPEK